MCDWLWALYFLSPAYASIVIRERDAVGQQVSALTESLLAGAVRLPWASRQHEAASSRARADVTRPDANAPEGPAQDEPEDILAELQPSAELQPAVTLL